MLAQATQLRRLIALSTPLGADELLLVRLTGREELSRPFEFTLEMLSEQETIDPAEIVGRNVSFRINRPTAPGENPPPRMFNGYVSRFVNGGRGQRGTEYQATVVPWLWFLKNTTDCRIFQNKSTVEIVEQIFTDLGFHDFAIDRLTKDYPKREYCVQYRETDFDFVSRLLEEEGIWYFFEHDDGQHTLVLADAPSVCREIAEGEVQFALPAGVTDMGDQIKTWRHRYKFRPGRWSQTDFNFKTPKLDLASPETTLVDLPGNARYEQYDFPGNYGDKSRGKALSRIRMEEIEATHDRVAGSSTYRTLSPGARMTIGRHCTGDEAGRQYTLVAVEHRASADGSYLAGTSSKEELYANEFECLPAETSYRPERITRRPIVEGPQTAIVVGPAKEQIWPDEHGRVKVQFHWDREGVMDEYSSCWVRVSQGHAGASFGGIDLPRVGEEVIVDFLEGDPDKPIITGRVYNAANMPPFALPGEKTRSGMKSNTHKGKGYNEISMDDTAGAEQIRMHGQHNMDTTVGNNQTLVVGVDRTTDIGNDDKLTVGNNASESVGVNKEVKVGTDMNTQVGAKYVLNAGTSITLRTGAAQIHMNKSGLITITGTIITIAASANASMAAPLTEVVGGVMLTTLGGVNMVQGGVTNVGAVGLCSVSSSTKTDVVGGVTQVKGAPIKLN